MLTKFDDLGDAFVYMVDCQVATFVTFVDIKRTSKYEIARMMSIAYEGISHAKAFGLRVDKVETRYKKAVAHLLTKMPDAKSYLSKIMAIPEQAWNVL